MQYDKQFIIEAINKGYTRVQIAQKLGIAPCTLTRFCTREHIKFRHRGNPRVDVFSVYPEINEKWLAEHWLSQDISLVQLATTYNIPLTVLETRRTKYNLRKHFKYRINTQKLFNLKDPNVYYLAGLLATDGYFPKGPDAFELTLRGSSEKLLLQDILNYFEGTCPLQEVSPNTWRIRVCAKGIRDFFQEYFGIFSHNKTFTVQTPQAFFNKACALAYLRGCLDGDGHFARGGDSAILVAASRNFVESLYQLCTAFFSASYVHLFNSYRNYTQKSYPGIRLNKPALTQFYAEAYPEGALYLRRKYERLAQAYKV